MAVKDEEQREGLIRLGATGQEVAALQSRLNELGFAEVNVDGVFGAATEDAVKRLQSDRGLPADGIAGPETLDALEKLAATNFSADPVRDQPVPPPPTKRDRTSQADGAEPTPADAVAPELRDDTQTLLDRPADLDQLGRRTFARVLALRLRDVRNAYVDPRTKKLEAPPKGPFMLHLHGAWGSGKSSLLTFLADELRDPKLPGPEGKEPVPWIVVWFNAWEHQRVAPPWWWLMTSVYSEGKHELGHNAKRQWVVFQFADIWWRVKHGWRNLAGVLLGLAVIAAVVWLVWTVVNHTDPSGWLKAFATIATPLGAILGVCLTIVAATRGVRDWLLVRSAAGAKQGLVRGVDPLATIKSRYKHVAGHLGRPLAVVIDDLDRCQPQYVVDLLEGIQTLFAESPVVYVVAADGAWIRDSFEDVYTSFLDMPSQPGRPLGYHFLEKTFQLSADVPRLTPRFRRRYFRGLLGVIADDGDGASAGDATEAAASARTDEELRTAVASSRTPGEEAAAVEAALVRAESSELRLHTEHRLADFDGLLERNPRAMKRLINAYGLARDIEFVEAGGEVAHDGQASEELALWTILRLRWPLLGLHFEAHPDDVARIGKQTTAKSIPEHLRPLFFDPDVVAVVRGEGVQGKLDEVVIRRLTGHERVHERMEGGGSGPPPSP